MLQLARRHLLLAGLAALLLTLLALSIAPPTAGADFYRKVP